MNQLGMILFKLFRNIRTAFAKRAPIQNNQGMNLLQTPVTKNHYSARNLHVANMNQKSLWIKSSNYSPIDRSNDVKEHGVILLYSGGCVFYMKINEVTKPFQYPIQRCENSVAVLSVGAHCIWIITPDSCQGYHHLTYLL